MLRSKSFAKGMITALTAGAFALPMVAGAQDNRPVVVVFTFQNSALGPAHGEFDNISTAVQDLLITDMASNAKVRLVDRAHIAEIQAEQNMVKGGMIDPQTAIRVGKIMGAQYAVTGGWIADKDGKAILTGRTIDIETSQIGNAQKIEGKADNVLAMISDLSSKLNSGLNLAPKPGAPARRGGDAGDAGKSGASQSGTPASSGARTSSASKASAPAKSAVVEFYKPMSEKSKNVKLDAATLKLYSSALDALDRKNTPKAKELLQQVLKKYDGWEPAQRQLDKIS
jgi:TolB-like protein